MADLRIPYCAVGSGGPLAPSRSRYVSMGAELQNLIPGEQTKSANMAALRRQPEVPPRGTGFTGYLLS